MQGIATLNPQRWGGGNSAGYSKNFAANGRNGQSLLDQGDDDGEFEQKMTRSKGIARCKRPLLPFLFSCGHGSNLRVGS